MAETEVGCLLHFLCRPAAGHNRKGILILSILQFLQEDGARSGQAGGIPENGKAAEATEHLPGA